jgi:hypothetical protein
MWCVSVSKGDKVWGGRYKYVVEYSPFQSMDTVSWGFVLDFVVDFRYQIDFCLFVVKGVKPHTKKKERKKRKK